MGRQKGAPGKERRAGVALIFRGASAQTSIAPALKAKNESEGTRLCNEITQNRLAFVTETDPAGVGVMKTSAVIDEESDSLIKINYGAAVICIRLSCLRIS